MTLVRLASPKVSQTLVRPDQGPTQFRNCKVVPAEGGRNRGLEKAD